MPLSQYYGGHGESVMSKMKKKYGGKKGERVFYATQNKMKNKGECKTCMGRKVEYHSPAKHPEQGDAMSPEQMDQMVEDAAKRSTGSYSNARQMMKPAQQTMPRDTGGGGALEYMRSLLPGGTPGGKKK